MTARNFRQGSGVAVVGDETVMSQESDTSNEQQDSRKLPFWKVMFSIMSASFGVQSKKNKERDFGSTSVKGFVAAALIFTFVFIMVLVTIVSVVLP